MQRRSGQLGVPVITAGDEVIIGFDQRRLEQVANRYRSAPSLGLRVKDDPIRGVVVGGSRPGSPAERAGVQPGDVVEAMEGQPIRTVADLERITRSLSRGRPLLLVVRREDQRVQLPVTLG
jgi:S1-C subfamily serine protease